MNANAALDVSGIRVFWAPGCTSCLRTKEFLARRGIPFESVNVKVQANAMSELAALGARSVPVVSRGTQWVYAQSIQDVTDFLGLAAEESMRLSPMDLADRVDRILVKAMGFTRQLPAPTLDSAFRDSWIHPRGLAHHAVRVVEAFLDAMEQPCELSYELIMQGTYEVVPGQDIVGYAQAVRSRFATWWKLAARGDFSRIVPTYYGPQTLHEVLERTTWHSAQHARQLQFVIECNGWKVLDPFTTDDLAHLPLPEQAWDDTAAAAAA